MKNQLKLPAVGMFSVRFEIISSASLKASLKSCIICVSKASKTAGCPICREKLDVKRLTKAHPFIIEHLSTAQMSCPFQDCAESNIYEAHINHMKICSKGPATQCPFCKELFPRMKFEDHLENCVER